MAMEIAREFTETEAPELVRLLDDRTEREVYKLLSVQNFMLAVLLHEFWCSYKYTGRIPA